MNELRRFDVTVTVARDGGPLPGPAEFALAAELAAARRAASVVSAHTAEEIISVVTVRTPDRPAAVTLALAVVSEALRRPVAPPAGNRRDVHTAPHLTHAAHLQSNHEGQPWRRTL